MFLLDWREDKYKSFKFRYEKVKLFFMELKIWNKLRREYVQFKYRIQNMFSSNIEMFSEYTTLSARQPGVFHLHCMRYFEILKEKEIHFYCTFRKDL